MLRSFENSVLLHFCRHALVPLRNDAASVAHRQIMRIQSLDRSERSKDCNVTQVGYVAAGQKGGAVAESIVRFQHREYLFQRRTLVRDVALFCFVIRVMILHSGTVIDLLLMRDAARYMATDPAVRTVHRCKGEKVSTWST